MRLKSHRHRLGSLRAGARNDLVQHALMSTMHAVEVPDAQQRRAKIWWHVLYLVKNLHSHSRFSIANQQLEIDTQISNSSFIPSYDNFVLSGRVAFVASCGKS